MNPSLLLIPDRYKASKLYSQIPDSGAGDLAFTRALDTATRVNSEGLIEKVRTNIALYSEQFNDASWLKINVTATANSTTAPDGTLTADTILSASASASAVYQAISSEAGMTFSVYAKANTSNFIAVTIFDVSPAVDYMAIFDLSNGTFVGNGGFSSVDSYFIENAGNGWYRLSITKNVGAVGNHNYVLGVAKTGNSAIPVAGTSVFVWGAQVEASDFGATPYIPTTTAAVSVGPVANIPRIDYTGGGCGKLLLEPQRTNNVTYSEQLNNAAWTLANSGSASAAVVTANYGISPDGTQNADRVQFSRTGTTSSDYSLLDRSTISTAAGVVSFYGKSLSGTQSILLYYGGVGQVFTLTTEWQRFSLYNPTTTTDLTIGTRGGSGNYFNGGSLTIDCLLWGFQKEAGAYPTSYINTLGASVTRSADAASKTGISSLIGTEFTIFYDGFETIGGTSTRYLVLKGTGGTYANAVFIEGSSANTLALTVLNNASATVFNSFSPSLTNGQRIKFAVRCKDNDFAFYVNGSLVSAQASGSVPTTADLYLGYYVDFADNYSLPTTAAIYTSGLSNAELATLTSL
jgi:hypothetical protein